MICMFGELGDEIKIQITVRVHLTPVGMAIYNQENTHQTLLRTQMEKGALTLLGRLSGRAAMKSVWRVSKTTSKG